MARELLRRSDRFPTMNRIDELELLANVSAARREAKLLLAETSPGPHSARLRRIIGILAYMREHLEMLTVSRWREPGTAPAPTDAQPSPTGNSHAADSYRPDAGLSEAERSARAEEKT